MLRPGRALLHPLWLIALGVHALNDHVLKGGDLLPRAVTGKLSDVAVLLVTPLVLAALARVRTRRGLAVAHLAIGALYVALELSPTFTGWWAWAIGILGFRWVTWSDWTDLLVLPVLGASWVILGRAAARSDAAPRPARRALEVASIGAAGWVCIATSDVDCPQPEVIDPDDDADGAPWSIDCDDHDARRSPRNAEIDGDGIDGDCDGYDDVVEIVLPEDPCADAQSFLLDAPLEIDTSTANDHDGPSCDPGSAPAVRLRVAPTGHPDAAMGWLSVAVDSAEPHLLSVHGDCPSSGAELACTDAPATAVRVLVREGVHAYVTLRPTGAGGVARVVAHFEPLACGDGEVVAPETCDDGNRASGDGCSALCRREGSDT